MKITIFIASVLIGIALVSDKTAEAVRCYSCLICGDTNAAIESDCTFCAKGQLTSQGTTVVARECVNDDYPGDNCETSDSEGVSATYCTCATDLCNASQHYMPSVVLVVFCFLWIFNGPI